MNKEIEYLQNFGDVLNLRIFEKLTQDKRKTVKKYFATFNGTSVSPVLDYEQLNCFMIGWKNAVETVIAVETQM